VPDQTFEPADFVDLLSNKTLDLIDKGLQTPIILIDGRAGSGKSTLADALQRQLFRDGETLPRVIHMDDLYEGWDGLDAGADYLQRMILNPLLRGQKAEWQMWDWSLDERNEWREFSGGTPLIIEGCGSLNRRSAESGVLRIWLEVDEEVRHERWIDREGNDEYWSSWAAQELDFYAREKSAELANEKVA
jgi:uridine kinase